MQPDKKPVSATVVCVLAGFVALAAWLGPLARSAPQTRTPQGPELAFGVYTYGAFMVALVSAAAFLSSLWFTLSPAKRRRSVGLKIAALGLGLAAILLPWEVAAKLLPPSKNPFYTFNEGGTAGVEGNLDSVLMYQRPPHLKWEGWSQGDVPEWLPDPFARKVSFQTDHEGFRNSRDLEKADLVFIGDSFTEAGNVAEEETFVQRAGLRLGKTTRNLGLFACGPLTQLEILKQYGLKCQPKAVVWQFCEGNDLADSMQYLSWRRYGGHRGVPRGPVRHSAWEQRSPSYNLFLRQVRRPRWWLGGTFEAADGTAQAVRFGYWPSPDRYPLGHPQAPWSPRPHPGWGLLVGALKDGHATLKERNIPLLVTVCAMKISVLGARVDFDDWSRERMKPDWQMPGELTMMAQVAKVCAEAGIPFVDPTEQLRTRASNGELVYLPFDTHLSPLGHEVVGEAIADGLLSLVEAE